MINSKHENQNPVQTGFQSANYPGISGKTVVITGSANGIGLAMANSFARQGARLLLVDINDKGLAEAKQELEKTHEGIDVEIRSASVIDDAAIESVFAYCEERFGSVDILLNNAGISINKPSLELTPDEWRHGINVNLNSVFVCAQAAALRMVKQGSGVIINTSSMYGVVAAPHRTAYCAAKAGIVALTKSLAVEWGSYGIRMNAIGPGYTRTPLVDELGKTGRLDLEKLSNRTPLGRLGEPQEMAELALFLASDSAAFVTGHILVADGGWTANGYM